MVIEPVYTDTEDDITYSYYPRAANFTVAKSACERAGSHLAFIENKNLLERIEKYLKTQSQLYWWVGLHKEKQTWKWLDGSKLDKGVIDFSDDSGRKKCAALFKPRSSSKVYLYDYGCDEQTMHYFCESRTQFDVGQPTEAPHILEGGAIAASAVGLLIIIALVVLLVFRLNKQKVNQQDVSQDTTTQSNAETIQCHQGTNQKDFEEPCYAVILDDPKYATLDIYSEIKDNHTDSKSPSSNTNTEVKYAIINKKSSEAKKKKKQTEYPVVKQTTEFETTSNYSKIEEDSITPSPENEAQYAQIVKIRK